MNGSNSTRSRRTAARTYWDETQAVVSPDGQKILFVSRWNNSFADGRRMFVLDLTSLGNPGDCGKSDAG